MTLNELDAKVRMIGSKTMSIGEYKRCPMVVFGTPDDHFPFQFGATKARQLLAAVEELGADKVIDIIREVVAISELK